MAAFSTRRQLVYFSTKNAIQNEDGLVATTETARVSAPRFRSPAHPSGLRNTLRVSTIRNRPLSYKSPPLPGDELIPVDAILEGSTSAKLFHQFVRLYHYGHRMLPGLSVATLALYASAGRPCAVYALAGAVTVAMIPHTWVFMVPTNNTLFDLHARSQSANIVAGIDEAKGLLRRWSLLHLARSLFPLTGAVIGLSRIVGCE
ncbi:hypothetical protein CMUS01_04036 [Colletotrichum musicola]|uniref:Uncharacterized protein n=1 Tax=Colletotrichum musicola TaxID=2175873 RepID=A0A8H6NPG1_9PEZI|nr:hypothetical protein CMUS01_04036 [Colletotrichum musicola]